MFGIRTPTEETNAAWACQQSGKVQLREIINLRTILDQGWKKTLGSCIQNQNRDLEWRVLQPLMRRSESKHWPETKRVGTTHLAFMRMRDNIHPKLICYQGNSLASFKGHRRLKTYCCLWEAEKKTRSVGLRIKKMLTLKASSLQMDHLIRTRILRTFLTRNTWVRKLTDGRHTNQPTYRLKTYEKMKINRLEAAHTLLRGHKM